MGRPQRHNLYTKSPEKVSWFKSWKEYWGGGGGWWGWSAQHGTLKNLDFFFPYKEIKWAKYILYSAVTLHCVLSYVI
jgi:hypothetical protein